MANNYFEPINNHFGLENGREVLEDVDDDIFLSNSRTNSRLGSITTNTKSNNPFNDEQQQIFAEKRREIEARTLESSQKSLSLLYETEQVGQATAEELAKQREQLEKTTQQLDEINTTLRSSQRYLNSLKSVFGGLKNYIAGGGGGATVAGPSGAPTPRTATSPTGSNITQSTIINNTRMVSGRNANVGSAPISPTEHYDKHPISRIRGDSSAQQKLQQKSNNPFETQLEANLDEMCDNLTRLKFLATDLGTEVESQNELLDNMNYKIENVDVKMVKQNKEMNKLLGKK